MSNKAPIVESLEGAHVHVWRIRLTDARRASVISHFALRDILSRYLAGQDIVLKEGEFGKPEIADVTCALKFNLTHSNDRALCAIALEDEVGVDIEKIRDLRNFDNLIERFLSCDEIAEIRSCVPEERTTTFFEIWTAREAYLKAIGVGLKGLRDDHPDEHWSITPLATEQGYIAALAVKRPEVVVSYYDWVSHG